MRSPRLLIPRYEPRHSRAALGALLAGELRRAMGRRGFRLFAWLVIAAGRRFARLRAIEFRYDYITPIGLDGHCRFSLREFRFSARHHLLSLLGAMRMQTGEGRGWLFPPLLIFEANFSGAIDFTSRSSFSSDVVYNFQKREKNTAFYSPRHRRHDFSAGER